MARQRLALDPSLELVEISAYQTDIEHALRLYFSPTAPTFASRFFGKSMHEVREQLAIRLDESDRRSSLILLTSLEASFRLDFNDRCGRRLKDKLSRYFRGIQKSHGDRVRFDDILEGWKQPGAVQASVIDSCVAPSSSGIGSRTDDFGLRSSGKTMTSLSSL
jgi:hypothetical protein